MRRAYRVALYVSVSVVRRFLNNINYINTTELNLEFKASQRGYSVGEFQLR